MNDGHNTPVPAFLLITAIHYLAPARINKLINRVIIAAIQETETLNLDSSFGIPMFYQRMLPGSSAVLMTGNLLKKYIVFNLSCISLLSYLLKNILRNLFLAKILLHFDSYCLYAALTSSNPCMFLKVIKALWMF